MSEDYRLKLIQDYLDAYNKMNVNGMMDTLHNDIEFINISGGEISTKTAGKEELRKLAEQSVKYFAERNQKIVNTAASEDKIIIDVDYEAVMAVDLPNGIKSGEKFNLKGRSEFTFLENKIKSITDLS